MTNLSKEAILPLMAAMDETNYIKLGFDMNGICQKVVYLG